MAHLTHKLPWASLAAAIPAPPPANLHGRKQKVDEAYEKKMEHLAAALGAAVEEFAATDKRSEEDKELYDVEQWEHGFTRSVALYGAGACRGHVESVINGYVALNLLVASEARVRPVLESSSIMAVHAGHHDGAHPEWLADKYKLLVDERTARYWNPKVLDADVVQGIRDYCSELFRCMYTRPDLFTRERILGSLWILHMLRDYKLYD